MRLNLELSPGNVPVSPELSVPLIELLILGAICAAVLGLLALRRPLYVLLILILFGVTRVDLFLPSLGPLSPSLIVELLVLAGFIVGLLSRRMEFKLIAPEAYFLIAFVLVCCLSTVLWGQTLYDWQGRLLFKDILVQLFLAVMVMTLVRGRRDIEVVAKAILVCALLLSSLSLAQYFFGSGSWSGLGGGGFVVDVEGETLMRGDVLGIHPNELAVILGMLFPMLIYLQLHHAQAWRVLAWLGMALLLATVALTFSRTGFLVLAFVVLMSLTVNRRAQFWLTIAALAAILVLVVPSLYWSRIGTLLTDREGSSRIFLYQAALRMIELNPIIGVGYGSYPYLSQKFYPVQYVGNVGTPHNIYLEILSETGILNLLIFGLLFWFLLHSLKTIARQTAGDGNFKWLALWVRTLRIGILAYLLAGLTTSVLLNSVIYIFIGLALATKKLFAGQIQFEQVNAATQQHAREPALGLAVH